MNSEVNNNVDIEEANWLYLLDTCQITLYFTRNDLIQVSSTCKQLRLKLKSRFHSKLELMRGSEVVPGKSNEQGKKKQLPILLKMLQKDYLDRYNIVNHCVIWEFFNSRFSRGFFSLFVNITRLELYSSYINDYFFDCSVDDIIGSNTVLVEALYPLKSLEFLTIYSELICSLKSDSKLYLKLPHCLKSLIIINSESIQKYFKFYPIENINEEYTNLKMVTIMRDRMLSNMMVTMKSLTDVTIFTRQRFNLNNMAQFLSLNPQLEKLTAPTYFLECNLVNSILQMNQLKQLIIKKSYYNHSNSLVYSHINMSIEYLNISDYISEDRLVPFLNSLKSLKVLEFTNLSLYALVEIHISAYEGRIPLLHLNGLWHGDEAIHLYNNIEVFDKIRFTDMFDLDFYLTNYKGNDLENWEVYHLDPANSKEFTMAKINQK
ncbi:hypothetical protein CONCODRAFT_7438 [Conidiobolus coronatus NRRL 28638]|uniref:F-box domain-containing protein n=1 Tax=Conidiobolus coronatus (strain ATCC 28846 / CBS 209.66 / NRRL 28638) TaxID=796925 RepID=A0A137P4W4_CONC2|nr:hypothetical protein CONCODRAFT_7438 [Conidiobolus coronatus NRRL 28638]|eukprot:KXN70045.1 hypothetical protein CONCODRAFT_7438 [Conidiobolus coronatus NRRL 28638]